MIVTISGMHCASCASGIETFLRSQDGVEMANVDFEDKKARIRHTDDADLNALWDQIEDMGYNVKPTEN